MTSCGGEVASPVGRSGSSWSCMCTHREREPDASWVGRTRAHSPRISEERSRCSSPTCPVEAVLDFAYLHHVTQVVLGESSRSRWRELARGSFVEKLIGRASNLDIHVIARREG